ncbi:MAG: DUF1329 domain-containing protein [Gammaproteobacteria bacterium]|nr:DUF1329 domain-containing protein [Gammaproteobacteria bacterium]
MFRTEPRRPRRKAREPVRALRRSLWLLCLCASPLLWPGPVHADQYRSEVKELDRTPAKAVPKETQELLRSTTDPYAKALLLRDLAAQALKDKDYAAAAKYLEDAIAQNSLSGVALDEMRKDLTQLYIASGRHKDVIAALEKTVKNNPKAPVEQQIALAAAYLEFERYADALPLLERAIAATRNPDESWLAALLGAYMGLGRHADAQALLDRLVRLNPARREYWMQLAALQLKAGQKERALATLELAQRQGHLHDAAERLQLIGLTAQLGAPFEAGSLMQPWIESGVLAADAENWKLLAGLWVAARESALAIPALEAALAQAPSAELYLQLGRLHMDREEYEPAARALEHAVSRGAASGGALMALGTAYYQQGEFDAAGRAFREAAGHRETRAAAEQWLQYVDNAELRGAQLAALGRRRAHKPDEAVRLSGRLAGATVAVATAAELPAQVRDRATLAGGALTPIGAEAGGNAAGTIPPWDGGLTPDKWPKAFKRGGRIVDPFPDDQPLFVITGANAAQHADKLTSGHRALLAKYPSYRLPVYPTRRSAAYPAAIYEATRANKGRAKLLGSDALSGAKLGFPFPEPASGVEILWNHRVRFRGNSVQAQSTQAVVNPSGEQANRLKQNERVYYRYANLADPADLARDNILLYYLTWFSRSGGSDVDFLALAHETANSMKDARAIWVLPPGIRKMFRIPPVGYDQPFPGSEGISFVDMIDMYNGAFDRYVWKLTGKRELYIPYNAYRLSDGRYKYEQMLKPGHFNPEGARYELHRVWAIEAVERGGKRHSFGKRMFYVDEDTWNVVLVENFDREGRLWRFQEGHLLVLYDVPYSNCIPVVTYDLKDGRYFVNRLTAEDPPPRYDLPDVDKQDFLPATVKNRYAR